MNVIEHYINLRLAFKGTEEEEIIKTTTATISDFLSCTMRNTNHLINKMSEKGFLSWIPQKGRGRKSSLIFHLPLLAAASLNVKRLLKERSFEEAYTYIIEAGFSQFIKDTLLSGIQSEFGLQSVSLSNGRKDTLKIPQETKIHTLDPARIGIVHEAHIAYHIFDSLIRYDKNSKSYSPGIALSWEETEGGKEWTFYLRKGILFHHGRLVEAKDVQYTIQRILNNKEIPYHSLFNGIKKIEIIDEITVKFILDDVNYMFLDIMSSFFSSILPHDCEINPVKPIGTGPYKVDKHDDHLLVLEVFPYYFQGRAFLDTIEIWNLPMSINNEIKKQNEPITITEHNLKTFQELGSFFFMFNMKKQGPHQDQCVRLAFQQLINSIELVEDLGFPRRMPAYSFIYKRSSQEHCIENSLTRAKQLLIQSSMYKGEVLKLATFDFKEAIEDMVWLKKRCDQIGLNIEISTIHSTDIYQNDRFDCYDLIYTGETFEENEELSLYMLYSSEHSILRRTLNTEYQTEIDKKLKMITLEKKLQNRIDQFYFIEKWLKDEAVVVQTYHTLEEQNYHKALNGITVSGYGMPDFRQLWVKPKLNNDKQEEANYSIYIP
ncbi:MarR-like DNA-binding transcriptional regulator SgrR of sgrS sRNA [Metabacillus crassostreae]|uniref:ABC transporter substrate-binding protein n=1 Tax=Metabacillus crassostreae TaxID=929098 RepID=UPI0019579A21|nr:ABC transporter substrate-binding protein [Metabacillus crassostreae]MBM7603735.1 MarR-like DNA-binding transcriptional regulator SgrR of sgrS sRNA [Metabacillus crassostreae]